MTVRRWKLLWEDGHIERDLSTDDRIDRYDDETMRLDFVWGLGMWTAEFERRSGHLMFAVEQYDVVEAVGL